MSKFTTELRFLCESESGLFESKGFNSLSEILYLSAPKIFNFDFPIFDESYRLPLEIKILRHYYTREISEETVGLWKLRLQDRLCMIMPYYNQLYESELIKFNPLYNYDLTSDYTKSKAGENTATGVAGEIDKYDKENHVINLGKITDSEDETNTINKSKTGYINNDDVITENEKNKTTDNRTIHKTGEDKRTPNLTDARAPLLKETRSPNLTDARAPLLKETRSPNLTDARAPLLKETKSPNLTDTRAPLLKEDHRVDDTKWNYYSDTPQGSIIGLDETTYLTNTTKDTNIGSNVVEYTGSESTSHTGTETKEWTGSESTSHTGTETKEWTGSESTSHTGTETKEWTGSESTSHTGTETIEKIEDITDNDTINTTKDNTKNVTKRENNGESGNETIDKHIEGETDSKTTIDTTEGYYGTKDYSKSDNASFTNTEDYLHHVIGKNGDKSYSKMLMEFRDTFLNIDAMIIKDLSNLFFGLWE